MGAVAAEVSAEDSTHLVDVRAVYNLVAPLHVGCADKIHAKRAVESALV